MPRRAPIVKEEPPANQSPTVEPVEQPPVETPTVDKATTNETVEFPVVETSDETANIETPPASDEAATPDAKETPPAMELSEVVIADDNEQPQVEEVESFTGKVNKRALGVITEHLSGSRYAGVSVPFDDFPLSPTSGARLTSSGTTFTPLSQVPYQAGLIAKDPESGEFFQTPDSTLSSEEAWLNLKCPSGVMFVEGHQIIE